MDMRVPFEVPPESVQDTDEARGKVFKMIHVVKHTKNNIADSLKEAVKERTVL